MNLNFKIYNTLENKKQEFLPLEDKKIKMYVCGMTVYDDCHLGHARVVLFFDLFVKVLKILNWDIVYVRNITDIDDKIINRAKEKNISIEELTKKTIASMNKDLLNLGATPPDMEPKASENMQEIMDMIEELMSNGYAYQTDDGNVYFEVSKFNNYGELSGKKLEDLLENVRIENKSDKKNNVDFALWKVEENKPNWLPTWSNGKEGRPGWHIECSAMSKKSLGNSFDIHGGGPDLIFPHHENEIAQSECCNSDKLANYWMHVGSLQVNGEKMSKSLKNFITIKQALEIYPKELIRFFMFSTHYRKPINWSEEVIQSSKNALIKIYKSLQKGMEQAGNTPKKLQIAELKDYPNATEFVLAMKDDFNTPKAISILHSISSKLQKQEDKKERPKLVQELIFCLDMLGAYTNDISIITGNKSNKKEVDTKKIEEQIAKRQEAKVNKDYALADKIREDLLKDGIELQDKPNGVVEWVKK